MEFSWIYHISPQWATFWLAMLPITELRASIPIAIKTFDLPIWQAFSLSVIGDIIPACLIIYLIGPLSGWLRRWKIFDRFFNWLFVRTRQKFDHQYNLGGKLALMIFVAIPLPGTGVWTGSIAAWLFGISKKESLIYVALGAVLAGLLVTLISLGIFSIFDFLLWNQITK